MKFFVIDIYNTKYEKYFKEGCTITHLGPVVVFEYDKEMSESFKGNERYFGMGIKDCDVNIPPNFDYSNGIVIMAGWGEKTGRYTLNFFQRTGEGSIWMKPPTRSIK
jgi:hypothetical protein